MVTKKSNKKGRGMKSRRRPNGVRNRANDMAHVANNKVVRFQPAVFGFPDSLLTSLRYHTLGSISSTSGVVGNQIFRWNSTFDPDATGGGHQPLYRDTYAAIYDHYSVVSATATIRFQNGSADPFIVGCVTDDNTTPATAIDTLCEQSHGYHCILTPLTGSLSSKQFRLAWDCKKVLRIDPFTSETYKTAVGSNPAEESDLVLWCSDLAGNTASITYDVELVYNVLWTELTTPASS